MKLNNLLTGAVLIMFTLLLTDCNKDDDSPYTSYAGYPGRVGYCSVVSTEGDLYLTGTRGNEILVMKTDLNGNLIWDKTYNLFGPSVYSHGWTIEETFDNGFLISGHNGTYSWDTDYNGLLKINAAGDSLWSIILQDSGHVALQAVVEAADHNIIVVHEDETAINEDLPLITISKISPDGTLIESKPYPELQMPEVLINGWQASQDGSVMISVSRSNQAASIWTINNGLDVTSQESFQNGKEVAYFTESPGLFICADEYTNISTHLQFCKAKPENDPDWEQDFSMPCNGWANHNWIGSVPGGYMVTGYLGDQVHAYYYDFHPFCMVLDEQGNQSWIYYDKKNFKGDPCNFHYISGDEYIIVVKEEISYENFEIRFWKIR
jgi:hypothetical protein